MAAPNDLHYFFKILFPMLTYGADKIIGYFLSNIFITADTAAPDLLSVGCSAYLLGLGFNVGLIVFVGAGWFICKDCHEGGGTDK